MSGNSPLFLIIDDERLARRELRRMLGEVAGSHRLEEAESVETARAFLRENHADAMFLDIQMPGGSGFDLMESLGTKAPPVIFTTAHSEFETRAFSLGAVDYLLKPFGEERLARALSRLGDTDNHQPYGPEDVILLKLDGECRLIPVGTITTVSSLGRNGTRISWVSGGVVHSGQCAQTLKTLTSKLDASLFLHASRDRIINLAGTEILPGNLRGSLMVRLPGGEEFPLSRRQASLLRKILPP